MSLESRIEWTNATWNPVTGCSYISEGCLNCYAKRMAYRLQAMGNSRYRNGFEITTHLDLLELPRHWKKPRLIFVNSMSDLFHEKVPIEFIESVFATIKSASWHRFQLLTKRVDRLAQVANRLEWPRNLWMGVTIESSEYVHRIDKLKGIPAYIKFVSFEPLLDSIRSVNLEGIDWAIVGGESGPHARNMSSEWARSIRDACQEMAVPFFFKQWGGPRKKKRGRILDHRTWNEFPKNMESFQNVAGRNIRVNPSNYPF